MEIQKYQRQLDFKRSQLPDKLEIKENDKINQSTAKILHDERNSVS